MTANPQAYRDLPQVYAEEISAHHRGVLRMFRRCGGVFVFDRFNNRRPSLAEIEYRQVTVGESDPMAQSISDTLYVRRETTQRKSSEAARRAGRSGGAATRARWARIKAEQSGRKKAA